jgi:putative two-component system response regulator
MNGNTTKFKLLIVDDSPDNMRLLVEILKGDYEIVTATSGEQALRRIEALPYPDLVLLDIIMPGIDGYEVCSRLKANEATRSIPVLFLSALDNEMDESKGLELGAEDYIVKPFSPSIVKARIRNHLELKKHRDNLEELVRERTKEISLTQTVTFMSLGTLAEFRDPETGGHIQRTSKYVQLLAEHLAAGDRFRGILTPSFIERLVQSSPLHDIGKVGIPDSILVKKGKLEPWEYNIMKTHAELGYRALRQASSVLGANSFLDVAMDVALSHHERWNGTGYPRGIAGDNIPFSARVMAVADVYDALTTVRPYKQAFSHEKSKEIMCEEMNGHFDDRILCAFLELEDDFKAVAKAYADVAPKERGRVPMEKKEESIR